MNSATFSLMFVVLNPVTALVADPTGQPSFEHPVIKAHGGIVVLPEANQQPQANSKSDQTFARHAKPSINL